MEVAAQWFQVDGTAAENYYPSNGIGGVTATSASNFTLGAKACNVYGILLIKSDSSARVISIGTDDGAGGGTALISITIAASQACPLYIPLGGLNGVNIPGPLMGVTAHTDTEFIVFYNKVL